jgi:hypothetical protein
MSAPQLSDPGASGEWFRQVESLQVESTAVMERRVRFQRLVTYTMVGLSAFAALGLICFAWRRHVLQQALEAPPPTPAMLVAPAVAPATPPAPVVAAAPESPTPQTVAEPVTIPPPPAPVVKAKPKTASLTKAKPVAKKKATGTSAFLKNIPSQPATLKRR